MSVREIDSSELERRQEILAQGRSDAEVRTMRLFLSGLRVSAPLSAWPLLARYRWAR